MFITPAQWKSMTPSERIVELQRQVDMRTSSEQPSTTLSVGRFNPGPSKYGEYDSQSHTLRLNDDLINQDTPYAAMETLHHEYRHSYQEYVATEHPELAQSPQQLADFQKNPTGYIRPSTDYSMYHSQPIEVDARNYARKQMEATYGQLNDPDYAAYRQARDQEAEYAQRSAELMYGNDHEDIARQTVYDIYDYKQSQAQDTHEATTNDQTHTTPTEAESESQKTGYTRRR